MDKDKSIIRRISRTCRDVRVNHQLTRSDMARNLKCSYQNIQQFEEGNNDSMYMMFAYIAIASQEETQEILNSYWF